MYPYSNPSDPHSEQLDYAMLRTGIFGCVLTVCGILIMVGCALALCEIIQPLFEFGPLEHRSNSTYSSVENSK